MAEAAEDGVNVIKQAKAFYQKSCTLWVHNESFSKQDVLFNASILPPGIFQDGMLLEITTSPATVGVRDFQSSQDAPREQARRQVPSKSTTSNFKPLELIESPDTEVGDTKPEVTTDKHGRFHTDRAFAFIAHDLDADQRKKHPHLQVSISEDIAQLFDFRDRSVVSLSIADENQHAASYVEIAFRDVYLARGDMWRLTCSELSGKTLYQGQRLQFLGTIKAVVKGIYANTRKVSSGLFTNNTRPIFRSESAKYVLYIQMSKEMWDFDESTGDIMFDKVINGFLPDLFRRWARLKARHVVSIVLFTRMEYRDPSYASDTNPEKSSSASQSAKDFYRVVVSEMASGDWQTVLYLLKKEFRVFLRDVSMHNLMSDLKSVQDLAGKSTHRKELTGQPSSASRGNILEAINLAATQFARDYVDRDLARTGLSVVIITPGTGVFDVSNTMLSLTTELLIENGIGIDVVCLSPIPLHAVPLFRYRVSKKQKPSDKKLNVDSPASATPRQAYLDVEGSALTFAPSPSSKGSFSPSASAWRTLSSDSSLEDSYMFAVPHWIDVSFWHTKNTSKQHNKHLDHITNAKQRQSFFSPRCRLYELQMMGFMETEASSISIPYTYETDAAKRRHLMKYQNTPTSAAEAARFAKIVGTSNVSKKHNLRATAANEDDVKQTRRAKATWMDQYDVDLFSGTSNRISDVVSESQSNANHDGVPSYDEDEDASTVVNSNESMARKGISIRNANTTEAFRSPIPSPASTVKLRQNATRRSALDFLSGQQRKASPSAASISMEPFPANFTTQPQKGSMQTQAQGLVSAKFRESLSRSTTTDSDQFPTQPILIQQQSSKSSEPGAGEQGTPSRTLTSLTNGVRDADIAVAIKRSKYTTTTSDPDLSLEGLVNQSQPVEETRPWLVLSNPSRPQVRPHRDLMQYRRWQHVYPKPQRAGTMKWKSLCSPAALPLTNGTSLALEGLVSKMSEGPYRISLNEDPNAFEAPKSRTDLVKELVAFRLSHGFQVMVGDGLSGGGVEQAKNATDIFCKNFMANDGDTLFMSKGKSLHQIVCADNGEILVTRFKQNILLGTVEQDLQVEYHPLVRTLLGKGYEGRSLSFSMPKEDYDWYYIDNYISGYQHGLSETLRFWRARFVLIPMDPPPSGRRTLPLLSEDSDEEVRLEGLQKLAQMWQKYRYMSPDQRRIESQKAVHKDTNPLRIEYQTRDPSQVVASGLENTLLTEGETVGPLTEVVTDSDMYTTESIDLHRLSQDLQSDKGIKIQNRRWHWRLHINSFVGVDLTTWLLANFKEIETREEAVVLGNTLMDRGLFQHVSKKHKFRDGNFFYCFTGEYRPSRPESRLSWFGTGRKQDKSFPTTPLSDAWKEPGTPDRAHLRTEPEELSSEPEVMSPAQSTARRVKAQLSAVIPYDVDYRRRSLRSEVISLHYDRLHNPGNAFHIQLGWGNATGGLVEDVLSSWTLTAEKHGLRLVQIPMNEASSIGKFDTFRSPYAIKLAITPPDLRQKHYFESAPATEVDSSESLVAHRAILKKFSFVLDYEAASNFPADVEVSYSWGKPDYQYSQYIHKSGTMLAQITSDGTFLLLANRLCNNKFGASRDIAKSERTDDYERKAPNTLQIRQSCTSRISPYSSPMVRPTQEAPLGIFEVATPEYGNFKTAEQLKDDIESFCHNEAALKAFYEELSRATATPSGTPALEATIPKLGLPPRIDSVDRLTPL